jgi:hypothetical protein
LDSTLYWNSSLPLDPRRLPADKEAPKEDSVLFRFEAIIRRENIDQEIPVDKVEVNDTAATVGIAMGAAGSDTAIEAADITLMQDDLTKLAAIIQLGRRTLRIIQTNIIFALAIKRCS